MKIEGNRPGDAAPVERPDQEALSRPSRAEGLGRGTDRVDLSREAALVAEAYRASQAAPDVRSDAVARARALLDAGRVGADADRLADRIIQSLLEA